jgi:transposase
MEQQLITMSQKELSRYEIIKRLMARQINGTEAATQAGLTIRQVKNIKARVIKEGAKGVIHKSRGKPSNRKIKEEKIRTIEKIIREKYYDFGPTFASEKLKENHRIDVSNEALRQLMAVWGL